MHDHKRARQILTKEMYVIAGKMVMDFHIHKFGDEKYIKSLQTEDFLLGLLSGHVKREWDLESSDYYKEYLSVLMSIKTLEEDEEEQNDKASV